LLPQYKKYEVDEAHQPLFTFFPPLLNDKRSISYETRGPFVSAKQTFERLWHRSGVQDKGPLAGH
jgi:hypothetical protein